MNDHPLMQYFAYEHLPHHLQAASKPFHDLARGIVSNHLLNHQLEITLQKLIEAKDAAVRSQLFTTSFNAAAVVTSAKRPMPEGHKAPEDCVYSRGMNEPRPRTCELCGETEPE